MKNECLNAVTETLTDAGVPFEIEERGKHIAVKFSANGREHFQIVARSASDWRSAMNDRAAVKRALRGDAPALPGIRNDTPVAVRGGKIICNSVDIADRFGREHKNVLRDIDRLIEQTGDEFASLNFEPCPYINENNREFRAYNLTRDAFSLVAMGFTGDAAVKWKIRYLEAFNAMEREILAIVPPPDSALAERVERLEGDLAALIDLVMDAPKPEPGFIIIAAHKRRIRGNKQ